MPLYSKPRRRVSSANSASRPDARPRSRSADSSAFRVSDLVDVSGIEREMLADLIVRDPVQALQVIEPLLDIWLLLGGWHRCPPIRTLAIADENPMRGG